MLLFTSVFAEPLMDVHHGDAEYHFPLTLIIPLDV